MDRYFCTTDETWLNDVNGRGLGGNPADVTTQWVRILKHPGREEWAAEIPEDYLPRLDEVLNEDELAEVSAGLKTKEEMQAAGWEI